MDAPGLSLFQGHTNININTDDEAEKLHEQEALKEQEERNQELGNQLMNAFDDLDELDEDDITANSLSRISESEGDSYSKHNSPIRTNGIPNAYQYNGLQSDSEQQHINREDNRYQQNQYQLNNPGFMQRHNGFNNQYPYKGNEQVDYGQGDDIRYLETKCGSVEQLRVLYDVRVREVQDLTTQLEESRAHSEHTISELRKQLILCESEKKSALMTRQQTQELLVQTKTELGNLHNKIDSLNSTIKCLEQEKETMKNELVIAKASLQDSYQRLQIIDRGFGNDKHLEIMLKNTKERHAEEVRNFENTISNLRTRMENYETEVKLLETRNKDLHREQEKLLLEKAETINQLAKKLEDNQKQYQTLLESKNNSEDFSKLQREYEVLERQNESLKRQLDEATNILESLAQETHTTIPADNYIGSEAETDSMCDMNLIKRPPNIFKRPEKTLSVEDRLYKLQNELRRCIIKQRDRHEEIKMMQEALASKDAKIKSLQDNESAAMFQASHYRDEAQKLANKLVNANSNLENVTSTLPSHNDLIVNLNREKTHLANELEKLKMENKDFARDTKQMETELEKLRKDNAKLLDKIHELEQLSQMSRKISAESTPYNNVSNTKTLQSELDKLKFQLSDAQKEVDRYKTLYIDISGNKDKISKELEELKGRDFMKHLREAQDEINRLQKDLSSANSKILDLNDEIVKSEKRQVKEASPHNRSSTAHKNCTEHIAVIKRLESDCLRMQENCTEHKKELVSLNTKLLDAGEEIAELKMNLELKKQRDCMIEDLKLKAQQFEDFMYSQSKKHGSMSNSSSVDKSVSTSPIKINDPDAEIALKKEHEAELLRSEQKIRAEMAKLFANEIKILDDKYKSEKTLSEENFNKLIQTLNNNLQVRTKEVEVLKHAILTERANVRESMENRDALERRRLDEHEKQIKLKLGQELEECREKILKLSAELEERSKLLTSERESMGAVIKEWGSELKTLRQKQKEDEKTIIHLTEKYSNAKKCANNYKAYANDKEIHFTKEVERIKNGYEAAVEKMQTRMAKVIESGEKKAVERLKEIEQKYQDKLEKVKLESYRSSNSTSGIKL